MVIIFKEFSYDKLILSRKDFSVTSELETWTQMSHRCLNANYTRLTSQSVSVVSMQMVQGNQPDRTQVPE